jgi:D-aminopeptidase
LSHPRVRDTGIVPGQMALGARNTTTLISGEGLLRPGQGPVRTGVTIVLPHGESLFRHKVRAAVHTINGFGKVFGFEQVRELGVIESPIALTNTLNVGLVADALIEHAIRRDPEIGISTAGTVNVVVGETNDGYLNDIQGRHVGIEQVLAAIESASAGRVAEGAVGAGTGTICFGWKGGIGTASRVMPEASGGYTVGALVQSNFGRPSDLVVCGVPVGREIQPPPQEHSTPSSNEGSVMVVLATDAPLDSRQLARLCVRAGAGLARTGSYYGHGSGDFVIAFSTAHRVNHAPVALETMQPVLANEGQAMQWLFPAVVECVEEAVLNSLFRAETMTGRDGHTIEALPVDRVVAMCHRVAADRER